MRETMRRDAPSTRPPRKETFCVSSLFVIARVLLQRMADVARARLLFSRTSVGLVLLWCLCFYHLAHRNDYQPTDAVTHSCVCMLLVLGGVYARSTTLDISHRLLIGGSVLAVSLEPRVWGPNDP